jgi:hypothetical protein
MTSKGKTNLLFCHIVSLSCSFFTFHSVKLLVCVIMGICESVVMCYNTELVYFARFVERNCMFP